MPSNIHSTPLVTTIAVCYNHALFCTETLNSIQQQTYSNHEIIIIDDYSTDKSVEIIEEWMNNHSSLPTTFIKNTYNKGICACLNAGIDSANGAFINLIACDDVLMNSMIEKQVSILNNSHENIGFCFSNYSTINKDGLIINETLHSEAFSENINLLSAFLKNNKGVFIHPSSCLVKREVYNHFRYIETMIQEDLQFFIYLFKHYKGVSIKESLLKYRILDNSLSRNKKTKKTLLIQNIHFTNHLIRNSKDEAFKLLLTFFLIRIQLNFIDYCMNETPTKPKRIRYFLTKVKQKLDVLKHKPLTDRYYYYVEVLAKKHKKDFIILLFNSGFKHNLTTKTLIHFLWYKKHHHENMSVNL